MKTRVNLYSAELHPTLHLLSLSTVLVCWLFLGIIIFIIYALSQSRQAELETQLAIVLNEKQQQNSFVNTLQTGLADRSTDPKLIREADEQKLFLAQKKRVFQVLSEQKKLKDKRFSTLMRELATHHPSGLWLTHITLDGDQVILEGAANTSSVIPEWIKSLGNTTYFSGQEFSDTHLFRDAQQQLHFVISSALSNDSNKPDIQDSLNVK